MEVLKIHYTNKIGQPIKTPYYLSQLQILYENDFFPWVISDGIAELVHDGFLTLVDMNGVPDMKKLKNITKINFYANAAAIETPDDLSLMQTHAMNIANIVDEYSSRDNSDVLGRHLETLVKLELRAQQFSIAGVHTNEYRGKKWTETRQDLDIIAEHKSGKLNIGVQVKNSLNLMEPEEIDTQIDICAYLGLVPVFAVRWIKPYIDCIFKQGGFCWVFKSQVYPIGFEKHVKNLYDRLSELNKVNSKNHPLQFPVTARGELTELSIQKFQDWVQQCIETPPLVNTSYRCQKFTQEEETSEIIYDLDPY